MKPSELIKSYILSKQLPKQQNELSKYFECCFEKLDNNFIDREELKDKINKILNKFAKTTDIDGRETLYKYTDCDLADLRAEILELLK